jgi:uncharacterized membrane protein YgcG
MAISENVSVKVSDLRLDQDNPRLGAPQANQQATAVALAEKMGKHLLVLAKDIVEHGVDPSTRTIVVPTEDLRRKYIVIEGNRRLLVLKALETPALVASVLSVSEQRQLEQLSKRYLAGDPYDELECVLFGKVEDAAHWIWLRHTGANDGAGLVGWGTPEQQNWKARAAGAKGKPSLGVQALNFTQRINGGPLTTAKVATNVDRLVKNRDCRDIFGLDLKDKELLGWYPAEELMKPLRKIIEDLGSKRINVTTIYYGPDQLAYAKTFSSAELPDSSKRYKQAIPLTQVRPSRRGRGPGGGGAGGAGSTGGGAKGGAGGAGGSGGGSQTRTTLARNTSKMNPTAPRINQIYIELLGLDVTQFPNAAAVLFRVFLELSVDHYIGQHSLKLAPRVRETLASKMQLAAEHLNKVGKINVQLKRAVDAVAIPQKSVLSASTFKFNQYVHNYYAFAKPTELFTSWDELEPFLEKLQ